MESDNYSLFCEFTANQVTPDAFQHYFLKADYDLTKAVDLYFRDSGYNPSPLVDVNSILMNSSAKRPPLRKSESDPNIWPRILSMFIANAKPSRTVQNLKAGTKLYLRPQAPQKGQQFKKKGKNKENMLDTEIRFSFVENEMTNGRLDHKISKFLHPLLSDGLILLKCVICENRDEVRFLDTFNVAIRVSLTKKAAGLEEHAFVKDYDRYSNYCQSFIELFKHLNIVKRQHTVLNTNQFDTNNATRKQESSTSDVVKLLNGQAGEIMEEAEPRTGFGRELYTHQKQALKWMLKRESDTTEDRVLHPLWEEYEMHDKSLVYFNPFIGKISFQMPGAGALCKGGILADEMGLGKTCMLLSLIWTDFRPPNPLQLIHGKRQARNLIILPLSLIAQWESEIEKYCPGMKYVEYHGNERETICIERFDIVLTSYGTLRSDHLKQGRLYRYHWHRVILDEAHSIKNKTTANAVACFKVEATNRWAITGTPIQNQIDDLYSLIKFLNVEPWSDYSFWRKSILLPFQERKESCFTNLREQIIKPMMIRRLKADVLSGSIPPLNTQTIFVELNPDDRDIYTQIKLFGAKEYEKIQERRGTLSYMSTIFEVILRLRQLCDHSFLVIARRSTETPDKFLSKLDTVGRDQLAELADVIHNEKDIDCPVCLEPAEDPVLIKQCSHGMCRACALKQIDINGTCPTCRRSIKPSDLRAIPRKNRFNLQIEEKFQPSAKIEWLVQNLPTEEKSVVFSQWTSMLDLLEHAFKLAGIRYGRVDGSMNMSQRKNALQNFKMGNSTVLLLSLKACGTGLDLTEANHVYLVDPWWNPAVEQQAIERVHRIGQKKDVFAYRLICSNTVEESILNLHKNKQMLVEGVMNDDIDSRAILTRLANDVFRG